MMQLEIPFDGNISLTISPVDPQLNKTFKGLFIFSKIFGLFPVITSSF